MRSIVRPLVMLCLFAGFALAQDQPPAQVGLQLTGLINSDAVGSSVTDHVTRSAGMRLSYTRFLNNRFGVEASYGYSRNKDIYTGSSIATTRIQTNINQVTADLFYRIPIHIAKLHPYALAGTGALQFRPTHNVGSPSDAANENAGVLMYDAGADWDLTPRIGLKVDYRNLSYRALNFLLPSLKVGAWTHLAEPSIGAFFRF